MPRIILQAIFQSIKKQKRNQKKGSNDLEEDLSKGIGRLKVKRIITSIIPRRGSNQKKKILTILSSCLKRIFLLS